MTVKAEWQARWPRVGAKKSFFGPACTAGQSHEWSFLPSPLNGCIQPVTDCPLLLIENEGTEVLKAYKLVLRSSVVRVVLHAD